MLATFLRLIVFACFCFFVAYVWHSDDTALAAALTISSWFSAMFLLTLLVEFVLIAVVNRRDPAPRAVFAEMVRAYGGEAVAALRVFMWWQPFRHSTIPDTSAGEAESSLRGVILLHGFLCNRGIWTLWMRELQSEGRPFVALNLEPIFGSIDAHSPQVEAAVIRMTRLTGQAPVLVCHSMGGLVARAWMRSAAAGAEARVSRIITIGSPHHGTWMGRLSPVLNGRQMRLASRWISHLSDDPNSARFNGFVCWFSNCDNIVFPASTATLPGAENRLVPGIGHVQMALSPEIRRETLALIRSL